MKSALITAALVCATALTPVPVVAQMTDVPEHPIVHHYPGALIDSHSYKEFDSARVITAFQRTPRVVLKREEVEGKVTKTFYIHQGNVSALQVMRNYENALRAASFVTLVVSRVDAVPGFEELRDGSYVGGFRLDKEGKPALWVTITIDPNVGEPVSAVTIVEPVAMDQGYTAGEQPKP